MTWFRVLCPRREGEQVVYLLSGGGKGQLRLFGRARARRARTSSERLWVMIWRMVPTVLVTGRIRHVKVRSVLHIWYISSASPTSHPKTARHGAGTV